MAVPVCTIDEFGITVPTYAEVLTYLQEQYRLIYGADIYLGNDGPDGQLLGIFAAALNDSFAAAVAVYNAFSPTTAQGTGLSSVVKVNGIVRDVPTKGTVDVTIVGQAGTEIINGIVSDGTNRWLLAALVTIPGDGDITVTATAELDGDITAAANTVTTIATPTRGWQTVTNASAAVPGAPVESDAELRQRQSVSAALPSSTPLEGMIGAIAAVSGVTRYRAYENDTDSTDSNGIPSHSLSFVIEGGDATELAEAIALKKTPGAGTYGTTDVVVTDVYGIDHIIQFYRPTLVPIEVEIDITDLTGYSSSVGDAIISAVVDYINSLGIGQNVLYTRLYVPANLAGPFAHPASPSDITTFELLAVRISRDGDPPAASDVALTFIEAASCVAADVTLAVS